MKTLPAALSRLCNRLAAEELKAHTWRRGQALRDETIQRLADGASLPELEIELQRRVASAALEQVRLTVAPKHARSASGLNASRSPLTS